MPPVRLGPKLLSWASEIDELTIDQARKTARLPFIEGHVALMPDAHVGLGATIGSVVPTKGAIIPAAVGVDIGCGMAAVETDLSAPDLPDDLRPLLRDIERGIPAGVGKGHGHDVVGREWYANHRGHASNLTPQQEHKTFEQFGTLGSGNHFIEICLDERDRVWLMLHSGSRGVGNELAQRHIARAKSIVKQWAIDLPDPDLAYFVQGTREFDDYIRDVQWAQAYAAGNRARMLELGLGFLARACAGEERDVAVRTINCHHNYTVLERHFDQDVWVTRKGAILAREGDWGIIPGSMGAASYIVRGKGEPLSFTSCAHGAGRRMSRTQARKQFTAEDLTARMAGRTWLAHRGHQLVDEIPDSYKDIDQVMRDQEDLVEVVHLLRQVVNYKGT